MKIIIGIIAIYIIAVLFFAIIMRFVFGSDESFLNQIKFSVKVFSLIFSLFFTIIGILFWMLS